MEKNEQFGGLDYFKIAAALLVVAIHTSPFASFNTNIDFVVTRVIARIAVPFFLMVTGYFLLPQYLFDKSKDLRPLWNFFKKTFILYAFAVVLYLPLCIYAGHFEGVGIIGLIRMLLFDGTFYHLWYLPASMLGIGIVYILGSKISFKPVVGICFFLYLIGLFGDSYYGFVACSKVVSSVYEMMFHIFSYMRNGIFYVPIFLVMGACCRRETKQRNSINIIGFTLAIVLMIVEGSILQSLRVQRHDSMYITLLPCVFFMFWIALSIKAAPKKYLRTISTWIYLLHPFMIVIVRGVAKVIHLEKLLIENSLIHYFTVCLLSGAVAGILSMLPPMREKQKFCMGRAWVELNKENLYRNVAALTELLPTGCYLMPAVKANAYGHGAVLIAKALNKIEIKSFCVASIEEGIELRKNGVTGEILILGYTRPNQFSLLHKYNLMQTIIDYSYAELLNSYGKEFKVHLKIDTGMHRLGERFEHIEEIYKIFQLKNLSIEGIYTHLSADETTDPAESAFTSVQGQAFYGVISKLKEKGIFKPKVHLLASYGLINYPQLGGDYARVGIALYGVLSSRADYEKCNVKLHPVLSVKTRITVVKDLLKGENAGYGLRYAAQKDQRIAVLAIGYADGLPRSLSGGVGKVLVNGYEAQIIGNICMDQTIIDVTNIPDVKQGDIAIVIGKSGEQEITVYDIAEQTGTITNEVLSRLGSRMDRIMIDI